MRQYDPDVFLYHAPSDEEIESITELRSMAARFAEAISDLVPACADRTTALRCVREALLWSNAAIVLKGRV